MISLAHFFLMCLCLFLSQGLAFQDVLARETTSTTQETATTKLRLCTGSQGNQYYQMGEKLKKRLSNEIDVEVIVTKGSWENLGRIDANPTQCDAMIAQDDAYALYQFEHPDSVMSIVKLDPLCKEYLHVLCNQNTMVNEISKLDYHKTTFYTMPYGSGSYITWALIKKLNPHKYNHFKEINTTTDQLLDQLKNAYQSACVLIVNDLAKGILETANDHFQLGLKLLHLDDPALKTPVGRDIKMQLYQEDAIHENIYPKLQVEHIETYTITASFFVSADWQISHAKAFERLVDEIQNFNR